MDSCGDRWGNPNLANSSNKQPSKPIEQRMLEVLVELGYEHKSYSKLKSILQEIRNNK